MMPPAFASTLAAVATLAAGFATDLAVAADGTQDIRSGASAATQAIYAKAGLGKPWDDPRDFADAERGLVARPASPDIRAADGRVVWTFKDYAALRSTPVPPTVNPLLWRQVQLNAASGLFKVVDGFYQVRGFDLANMTIVEGKSGVIVIDPLLSTETAKAALDLYRAHRGNRPVKAVIYTHSHMDHFGGVKGVVDVADVRAGRVPVLAPLNFLREAIVENVTAGNAMQRRTAYYSGAGLPRDALGSVDAGLGPAVATGTPSFIAPTDEIRDARGTRTIDGVKIEFTQAPNTEAPSEMVLYFPRSRVLDMAETATHTVHNLLTPRGAQVRSAEAWSATLNDALERYGDRTDALVGQHHWPTWGREDITRHLSHQRDFYRFVRNASLHLANQGAGMDEVGEALALPPELARDWALQDYYGTLRGAGKAVFQYYLGWYDGNPANLQKLPPVDAARRYVRYMGGAEVVLAKAQQDFDAGDYRWVAEVLNHVIFADPANAQAKALQARTFEQLGYQQVSATWRNLYLVAAQELRQGVKPLPSGSRIAAYLDDMPASMLLDYAGIALKPAQLPPGSLRVNLRLRGTKQVFGITVANDVLHYAEQALPSADADLALSKGALAALVSRQATLAEVESRGEATATSGRPALERFFGALDNFTPDFPLVTP